MAAVVPARAVLGRFASADVAEADYYEKSIYK
jgi:hypothetical protein